MTTSMTVVAAVAETRGERGMDVRCLPSSSREKQSQGVAFHRIATRPSRLRGLRGGQAGRPIRQDRLRDARHQQSIVQTHERWRRGQRQREQAATSLIGRHRYLHRCRVVQSQNRHLVVKEPSTMAVAACPHTRQSTWTTCWPLRGQKQVHRRRDALPVGPARHPPLLPSSFHKRDEAPSTSSNPVSVGPLIVAAPANDRSSNAFDGGEQSGALLPDPSWRRWAAQSQVWRGT